MLEVLRAHRRPSPLRPRQVLERVSDAEQGQREQLASHVQQSEAVLHDQQATATEQGGASASVTASTVVGIDARTIYREEVCRSEAEYSKSTQARIRDTRDRPTGKCGAAAANCK